MGFFPFIFLGLATGEISKGLNADLYTPSANALLIFSCALSAGIGFSAWWCRSLVSATSFTVIGTVNKILTVFLNIIIWDKHASVTGTFFLLLCLAGGAFYQQAPLRSQAYQKVVAESDKLGEVGGGDSTPIGGKASNGAVLSLQQTSK
jgi:GDP-mannose transporter